MPCHPNTVVCTHVKVRGVQCGSPAVRGEQFCYFHQRMFRGVPTPPGSRLHPVALLESDEAIQASIMEVVNALARNTIDLRRADLILKALWIAVKIPAAPASISGPTAWSPKSPTTPRRRHWFAERKSRHPHPRSRWKRHPHRRSTPQLLPRLPG